ncbi:MAG: hypothetical protein ABR576_10500 [Thermoanaerobaculia bacterium]
MWESEATWSGASGGTKAFSSTTSDARRYGTFRRAGNPAVIAMEITGHRTRSVFDRYDIATTDEARKALRTTVKFLRGEKEGRDQLRNSYGLSDVDAGWSGAWQCKRLTNADVYGRGERI